MRFILIFLLLGPAFVMAQSDIQQVVSSSGDQYTSVGHSATWTLGEIAIDTYNSSSHIFEGGFIHCYFCCQAVVAVDELQSNYSITVQPNPFNNAVLLELDGQLENKQIQISVFNLLGEVVFSETIIGTGTHEFNFDTLPSGAYYMQMSTQNELIKTTKIIKN